MPKIIVYSDSNVKLAIVEDANKSTSCNKFLKISEEFFLKKKSYG